MKYRSVLISKTIAILFISIASCPFLISASYAGAFPEKHLDSAVSSTFYRSESQYYNLYFWRENGKLWVEIEPLSETAWVCTTSFVIIQNDVRYDSVWMERLSGDSQCGDVDSNLVLEFTQLAFRENADLSKAFTILYDNGSEYYFLDVPAEIGTTGYMASNDLWIRAVIQSTEGPLEAVFYKGQESKTERGDTVIWGYFYADPADISWGLRGNPDLYVKIWYDVSGALYVAFFHVSVPDIDVYTDYPYDGIVDKQGTASLSNRLVQHDYLK